MTSKPRDPMDGEGGTDQQYARYLEVEFSSRINLTDPATRATLYVDADHCPIRDRNRIWAFGPYADGREIAEERGTLVERLPRKADNRRAYDYVPGAVRDLKPNPSDGRYHYTAYLLPSHPMPGVKYHQSNLEQPRYNLATDPRDVCIRLFAPGYNLTKSHSGMVVIPARAIATAFAMAATRHDRDVRTAEAPRTDVR